VGEHGNDRGASDRGADDGGALRRTPGHRRDSSAPWVVLSISMVLVTLATGAAVAWMEAREELRGAQDAAAVVRLVEGRMEVYVALLRGGASLFAASPEVDRDGFQRFVERLRLDEYPGIQGIGWSRRIAPGEEAQVVARARADGFERFELWPEPVDDGGPGEPAERHAILYLEPEDARNVFALGFDMHSEAVRRNAMDRARDAGTATASGIVRLVQEIQGEVQPGFLIYAPVYEGGRVPRTLEERRARLQGFVFGAFRVGDLFGALLPEVEGAPEVEVVDLSTEPAHQLFHVAAAGPTGATWEERVEVAGAEWVVRVRPALNGVSDARAIALSLLALGTLLTLLAFRSAWAEARAREQAEREHALAVASLAAEERHAQFRETFLGMLGHDLRNPLGAIQMNASALLRHGALPDMQRRALERIRSSSERAIRMVEQLLDTTRARLGGGIRVDARPVELAALARGVLDEAAASRADERFELDVAPELRVRADPDRLEQVLSNLAGNALAHGAAPFRMVARSEGLRVVIEVCNGGAPIPAEVRETLFDPFVRAAGADASKHAGLGLGLYISQQIAQAHGGSLEVESGEAGTCFRLSLPPA
jgi:two-component system, OmpR family, sensor kinase